MSGTTVFRCAHGVGAGDFCEDCAHNPVEEWVGYPMTICAFDGVQWPCAFEMKRRAGGRVEVSQTHQEARDEN